MDMTGISSGITKNKYCDITDLSSVKCH